MRSGPDEQGVVINGHLDASDGIATRSSALTLSLLLLEGAFQLRSCRLTMERAAKRFENCFIQPIFMGRTGVRGSQPP